MNLNGYRTHTTEEFEDLCLESCPDAHHEVLESPLPAYNIRIIEKR